MSDLSIYELDDIIWDDFDRSGDHIVPHPHPHSSDNHHTEDKYEDGVCKKPRRELAPVENNEGNHFASGIVTQERKSGSGERNTKEKESSSHTPDGVFTTSCDADSTKEITTLQSNNGDTKESNDLIYYGWPDIGNLEDMDTMLSNCDSSFGLGVMANDDELVWFQSEDPNGEYEEAFKMDLKFPCAEPSGLTNVLQDHETRESDNKRSSFASESKDELKIEDQNERSQYLKSNDIQMSLSDESDQVFNSAGNWQQNESSSRNQLSFGGNHEQLGMMLQASRNNLVSPHKQFGKENESESQSDTEGVKKGASAELNSLNAAEGSSINTELDEISIEASSFHQLQQVMEQLDLRTKLCIRDSLYRLARSAEQRHNYASMSDSTTNCGATGGPLMSEGTNKYAGLMDMETDTNPIDRTIAHLLFHRPSDSSNRPTPVPVKPNAKVRGSTIGSIVVADKLSCQGAGNESKDTISSMEKTNVSLCRHARFQK